MEGMFRWGDGKGSGGNVLDDMRRDDFAWPAPGRETIDDHQFVGCCESFIELGFSGSKSVSCCSFGSHVAHPLPFRQANNLNAQVERRVDSRVKVVHTTLWSVGHGEEAFIENRLVNVSRDVSVVRGVSQRSLCSTAKDFRSDHRI